MSDCTWSSSDRFIHDLTHRCGQAMQSHSSCMVYSTYCRAFFFRFITPLVVASAAQGDALDGTCRISSLSLHPFSATICMPHICSASIFHTQWRIRIAIRVVEVPDDVPRPRPRPGFEHRG